MDHQRRGANHHLNLNHHNHHHHQQPPAFEPPQPPAAAPISGGPNRLDLLFSSSESPQVQHKNILQRLSQEIEKSGAHKVRYVDSELYLRNQERRSPIQPTSEVQNTTLNIGSSTYFRQQQQHLPQSSASSANNNRIPIVSLATSSSSTITTRDQQDHFEPLRVPESTSGGGGAGLNKSNGNCQVCLIREVRQDLMNINKMVQERNEQIVKLKDKFKDKCLRSYFERQKME